MQEIIQKVTEKTGLPEAQAKMAVEAVMGFIKEKLPAPIASQVESLMSGEGNAAQDMMGKLGGMLGG